MPLFSKLTCFKTAQRKSLHLRDLLQETNSNYENCRRKRNDSLLQAGKNFKTHLRPSFYRLKKQESTKVKQFASDHQATNSSTRNRMRYFNCCQQYPKSCKLYIFSSLCHLSFKNKYHSFSSIPDGLLQRTFYIFKLKFMNFKF